MALQRIESDPVIPDDADHRDEIIAEFLKSAPQGKVLDLNSEHIPTGTELPTDNPIVTLSFIHSPDTKRTLDDFLKISNTQRDIDRERNRNRVFPRSATVFRSQASLRRA